MGKFDILKNVAGVVSRKTGRSLLELRRVSPDILVTVGVVGAVASTVLACRATLKGSEELTKSLNDIKYVKELKETIPDSKTYNKTEYAKDLAWSYARLGGAALKLYAPAIITAAVSYSCLIGSHSMLKTRNEALMGAFVVADRAFRKYRDRVVEEFGEEADRRIITNAREETEVVASSTDGKEVKKKVTSVEDPTGISIYARFFDECSAQWSRNADYNLLFLKSQQNWANDLLRSRGHVFLNEVYDALGIPHSKAGSICGWLYDGDGDGIIDFGIYDLDNAKRRDFVNGYEKSILLDFNVDGVIYDRI